MINIALRNSLVRISGTISCLILALPLYLACTPEPVAPPRLADDPIWNIGVMSNGAVMSTVSPYDTFRIVVQPKRISGAAAANVGPLIYESTSRAIEVNEQGLVRAFETSDRAIVRITLRDTTTGIVLTDTIAFTITNEAKPSMLKTFSIGPAPGDSTRLALASGLKLVSPYKTLILAVKDSDEKDLSSQARISYRYANGRTGSTCLYGLPSLVVLGDKPNCLEWIVVSTIFYGVNKRDSVQLSVGYPIEAALFSTYGERAGIDDVLAPDSVTIGVGGTVAFSASVTSRSPTSDMSYGVVFDDKTAAEPSPLADGVFFLTGSGDVPRLEVVDIKKDPFALSSCGITLRCYDLRRFSRVGIYRYRLVPSQRQGVIAVVP